MSLSIPLILSPVVRDYATEVHTLLGPGLTGIYLHGSIALDAFDERTSDIDFVTVIERELTGTEMKAVQQLHRRLRWEQWGRRLEGVYVHGAALTVPDDSRFPYVQHGRLRPGGHPLPVVARVLLHEHGVVVHGPPARELFPSVSLALLHEEMLFNLNTYWTGRLRRPWLFLSGEMAGFAVATLPRILHSLEHGTIISKQQGRMLLRERFPEWRSLVDETGSWDSSGILSFMQACRVIAFVRAMIDHGNALHNSSRPASLPTSDL